MSSDLAIDEDDTEVLINLVTKNKSGSARFRRCWQQKVKLEPPSNTRLGVSKTFVLFESEFKKWQVQSVRDAAGFNQATSFRLKFLWQAR